MRNTGNSEHGDDMDRLAREIAGVERRELNVQQKTTTDIPLPGSRPRGWIKYADGMAVVMNIKGKLRVRTGFVCSSPGSHGAGMEVDNVRETIVWFDDVLNEMADDADDAHEQGFNPQDPHLVRLDEVEYLRDPARAVAWFAGVRSETQAKEISALFRKPDFGYEEEAKEESDFWSRVAKRSEVNMQWWRTKGRPAPESVLKAAETMPDPNPSN